MIFAPLDVHLDAATATAGSAVSLRFCIVIAPPASYAVFAVSSALLALPPPLLLLLPELLHALVVPADSTCAGSSAAAGGIRAAGLCEWRLRAE
jgi:hypothetical protein